MSKSFYFSLKPLIPHRQLSRPLNWTRQFGREAPLEVEIGFGIGDYLLRTAIKDPRRNFIGIDNSWISVRRTLRKIAQTDLTNVRLLLADARVVFERFIEPETLRHVYALFPCPWPKKKHVKYRLFSKSFLKTLNNRLCKEGDFKMVTDQKSFVDWTIAEAGETGFDVESKIIHPQFDTKYERKWQGHGQSDFYELILKKREHIAVGFKEDVILQTFLIDSFNPEKFSPVGESGPEVVVFKEFLFDARHQKGLLEVITTEEGFRQHFWIAISQIKNKWQICVADGVSSIPTVAVKRALELAHEAAVKSGVL